MNEWETCDEPSKMLSRVRNTTSSRSYPCFRRYRLWMCASFRALDSRQNDEILAVVEAAEQYADGKPTRWGNDLKAMKKARKSISLCGGWLYCATAAEIGLIRSIEEELHLEAGMSGKFVSGTMSDVTRDIFFSPFRALVWGKQEDPSEVRVDENWFTPTVREIAKDAYESVCEKICVFCEEFPRGECPACKGKKKIIDGTLDGVKLSILADALLDAGCPEYVKCPRCRGFGHFNKGNEDYSTCEEECERYGGKSCDNSGKVMHPILEDLRSRKPHYKGNKYLDLILGKVKDI